VNVADIVREVLAQLGPEDRAAIKGVRLFVKDRPDGRDLERGCFPDQKAAFWGVGRELATHHGGGPLPDPRGAEGEITLFLANLAPPNDDPGRGAELGTFMTLFHERVRIAFTHEVAHALGFDEDTIRAMGLHLDEEEERCC
jgi:predicted Zn-dependent protease with MMP-like domain